MKVLIYGLRAVGVETAKNLALQGVGAITVKCPDASKKIHDFIVALF